MGCLTGLPVFTVLMIVVYESFVWRACCLHQVSLDFPSMEWVDEGWLRMGFVRGLVSAVLIIAYLYTIRETRLDCLAKCKCSVVLALLLLAFP